MKQEIRRLGFQPFVELQKESESEVAESCLTLWDPMDCSLPGSSVHGIFQARVLEWVASEATFKILDRVFLEAINAFYSSVFLFPVSYSWAVCLTTLSLEFLIYKIGKVIPHAVIVRLK